MSEQSQVQRRIDDFNRRNGPHIIADNWIWHANGATRDANQLGPMANPPSDPVKCWQNIIKYRRALLEQLVHEFDELKKSFKANPHSDYETGIKKLKQKQRTVRYRRRQLAEAEEQLRRHTTQHTAQEERMLQQIEADHAARLQRQRDKLDAISI